MARAAVVSSKDAVATGLPFCSLVELACPLVVVAALLLVELVRLPFEPRERERVWCWTAVKTFLMADMVSDGARDEQEGDERVRGGEG